MKQVFFFIVIFYSKFLFSQNNNFIQYINPFIGTGLHGHTFPGATAPYGMVQLSPDTRLLGWDGCSGYHFSDSIIYGFSHTHLSGTGVSDYGDILLMPMSDTFSFDNKKYASRFTHQNETSKAAYYKVHLDDDNIDVQLTSTARVGFHKYNFLNNEASPWVVLDLVHRDKTLEANYKQVNKKEIEGMRRSSAWAKDQHVYFVIQFSDDIVTIKDTINKDLTKHCHAIQFKKGLKILQVKVGISFVSIEGARKNLKFEIPHWDFELVQAQTQNLWEKELSKISVQDTSINKLFIFYTALYHLMIQPNIAMDIDHRYRGRDNKIHVADGFDYYTVFSLWDTFRGAHPLYTLIDKKRTTDFIKTFLAQYKDGGRLPVWELASNETDCMIGYHSASVITDAAIKGIVNFDKNLAFEAMQKSANWKHHGLPLYKYQGFLNYNDDGESVSKTLEYAYDDWCIAQMAKLLNNTKKYEYYMQRSQSWNNVFDKNVGFMRGKRNGNFMSPFLPQDVNDNFTEANSWQYSFFVPQNINGLMNAIGGAVAFEEKLDQLFTTSSTLTGREQDDIDGLIGQYAHGNEPSHHMAYLYHYVGKPYKSQQRVRQILTSFYHNNPEGLIGNEDCGQMSAWYVLNAIGMYPVTPGTNNFLLSSPLFKNITLNLENNKQLNIIATQDANANFYTKDITLNNDILNPSTITYSQIMQGGTLKFNTQNFPDTITQYKKIYTDTIKQNIISNPVIDAESQLFQRSLTINIKNTAPNCRIYYTSNGTEPTCSSNVYKHPIEITKNAIIKAISKDTVTKQISKPSIANFFKHLHSDWDVSIASPYFERYAASGNSAVVDGIKGALNWRIGNWQGYHAKDIELTIDMKKSKVIKSISSRFLFDRDSYILLPKQLTYYTSLDGQTFLPLRGFEEHSGYDFLLPHIKTFTRECNDIKARFIKIKAQSYGFVRRSSEKKQDTFLFIDEVSVR